MSLELLIELYNRGRVEFLLNGLPTEFANLDYLDEILEFEPPSSRSSELILLSTALFKLNRMRWW